MLLILLFGRFVIQFLCPPDEGMESEQRVLVLQQALQSIRDKYNEIRQELSSEERRLKRYKRRQKEREKEKIKHAQKASM